MSEKQNFSIDASLLSDNSSESVSGQITQALKLASDHSGEFIRFSRDLMAAPSIETPFASDLILQGALRFNLYADFGGIRVFAAKGTPARITNGRLRIDTIALALDDTVALVWTMEKNSFNTDELGVLATAREADNGL